MNNCVGKKIILRNNCNTSEPSSPREIMQYLNTPYDNYNNSTNVVVTRADCAMNYDVILYFMTLAFCTPLHCTSLYVSLLYCAVWHCTVLQCTPPHWNGTSLYYNALHCAVWHCTVLQCTPQHQIAPHYITIHCTALHCLASYCSTECSIALSYTAVKRSDVKRYLMDVHTLRYVGIHSRVRVRTPGDRKHSVTNNC